MHHHRFRQILRLLFPVFLAAACGAPSLSAQTADGSYSLREMDVISVQVFGEPELTKTHRIDGSGVIRVGLIGTVEVAGLTLREAENRIERAFVEQRFIRDPQVSIQVVAYASRYVSILGEVDEPGRVQLEEEAESMRLLDALSAVGGFTGVAKADAVRITRTRDDGSEATVIIDAEALINGRSTEIPAGFDHLLPGDVVHVPERLF